jgi:NAD+ diphosphatase
MPPRSLPGLEPPAHRSEVIWFAFSGSNLLVVAGASGVTLPVAPDLGGLGLHPVRAQYLGTLDGLPCYAAELPAKVPAPAGHWLLNLRVLFDQMDPVHFDVAGLAFQIQGWDRGYQFCPECAAPLAPAPRDRAKRCATCKKDYFPRVSPCTITLVHDGPRVLMTREARFPKGMYGLVAGYVEAGETLEACVAREVAEETGVTVETPTYFGSQPWPFPHQIMIGFMAKYAGGELVMDTNELEDAQWFHVDALPPLPPRISIARALLDAWLAGRAAL